MEALTTCLVVAVAVFLSSLVGLSLHRVVPDGHLSQVLGLLVSTAKSSYDATETKIQNYAAELILLDETLRDYGNSAQQPRRLLRNYTELFIQILWPKTGAAGTLEESRSASALMERVRETQPVADRRRGASGDVVAGGWRFDPDQPALGWPGGFAALCAGCT